MDFLDDLDDVEPQASGWLALDDAMRRSAAVGGVASRGRHRHSAAEDETDFEEEDDDDEAGSKDDDRPEGDFHAAFADPPNYQDWPALDTISEDDAVLIVKEAFAGLCRASSVVESRNQHLVNLLEGLQEAINALLVALHEDDRRCGLLLASIDHDSFDEDGLDPDYETEVE